MPYPKITRSAYLGNPFKVATDILLGATLCSNINGKFTAGRITELEVYTGADDKACHAYLYKKTNRNAIMFEEGGLAYIYFIYGMYDMFNVVVGKKGVADAILIRSLEPLHGIEIMRERRGTANIKQLTTGPGKLCHALGINRTQNGTDLTTSDKIWISPRAENISYLASKRIGIDYAEEDRDNLWRFLIKDNSFVSKSA